MCNLVVKAEDVEQGVDDVTSLQTIVAKDQQLKDDIVKPNLQHIHKQHWPLSRCIMKPHNAIGWNCLDVIQLPIQKKLFPFFFFVDHQFSFSSFLHISQSGLTNERCARNVQICAKVCYHVSFWPHEGCVPTISLAFRIGNIQPLESSELWGHHRYLLKHDAGETLDRIHSHAYTGCDDVIW